MPGCRYSHLLKTDEDCYVRLHKLVQAIHALPQPHASPQKLYLGELENPHGFWPIRCSASPAEGHSMVLTSNAQVPRSLCST